MEGEYVVLFLGPCSLYGDWLRRGTMSNHNLSCPSCGQVDQVQKVSAVVEGGTSTGAFTGTNQSAGYTFGRGGGVTVEGGTTTLTGTSRTQLAQRLALPSKPIRHAPTSVVSMVVWAVIAAGGGLLLWLNVYTQIHNSDGSTDPSIFWALYIISGIMIGAPAIRFCVLPGQYKRDAVRVQKGLPIWNRAYSKWVHLYYCHRCDGIFVQGRENLYPTKSIKSYLSDVEPVST